MLSTWLGTPVSCSQITRLYGGMLNSALCLELNKAPFRTVIKLSSETDANFSKEKHRLDYLRANSALRCPEVYAEGTPDESFPYAFLLMEHLPGVSLETVKLSSPEDRIAIDRQLADGVLELHTHTRETFGQIDEAPGPSRWSDIVIPRLVDMRDEMDGKLESPVLSDIDTALHAAGNVFQNQGTPSLIHGDLWAGNIMVEQSNGEWRISGFIDPGAQYADVEHELAYLQVFDTAGPTFFQTYFAHTPMRPGYAFRRLFYWLNTYMIHVWLFGDQKYRDKTASVASEIVRRL